MNPQSSGAQNAANLCNHRDLSQLLHSAGDRSAAESAARNALFEWLLACPIPLSLELRQKILAAIGVSERPETEGPIAR